MTWLSTPITNHQSPILTNTFAVFPLAGTRDMRHFSKCFLATNSATLPPSTILNGSAFFCFVGYSASPFPHISHLGFIPHRTLTSLDISVSGISSFFPFSVYRPFFKLGCVLACTGYGGVAMHGDRGLGYLIPLHFVFSFNCMQLLDMYDEYLCFGTTRTTP